jgi:phosphoribosylamine--glycine ligase
VQKDARLRRRRCVCVTALGDSVKQAQRAAYAPVGEIRFPGMQYRHDIGHRALGTRSSNQIEPNAHP